MPIFYDHLVIREEVTAVLDSYALEPEEKEELVSLIDSHLHQEILNVIFNHLPKEKHPQFTTALIQAPHDPAILDYLQTNTEVDIITEITNHAQKIKKDLLAEISKSTPKRKK